MKFEKCPKCNKIEFLTKHSKIGGHQPPFIWICRTCHDKIEGMRPQKKKILGKYVKGTKRVHKKGRRKR